MAICKVLLLLFAVISLSHALPTTQANADESTLEQSTIPPHIPEWVIERRDELLRLINQNPYETTTTSRAVLATAQREILQRTQALRFITLIDLISEYIKITGKGVTDLVKKKTA